MKKFNSEYEVEAELLSYAPQSLTTESIKLERIKVLLERIGNPQQELKVIHVAGTSGKTSTAYFVRALLEASGLKTGLTVSPHIETIRERVQVGGLPLSEKEFAQYFNEFYSLVIETEPRPTFFEMMTAFAYWVFLREKVDYAVIETGLGGRLDATNMVDRSDKVCIITPVGYDHTEILGDTLEKIASEKAGIIGNNNVVFLAEQETGARTTIENAVRQKQALLRVVNVTPDDTSAIPAFQQQNFSLALETARYVAERDAWPLSANAESLIGGIHVPGRWELYSIEGKTVLLDGAHNPQKLEAFFKAVTKRGLKPAVVVAGLSAAPSDKVKRCVEIISQNAVQTIYTIFEIQRDVPRKSVDLATLAQTVEEIQGKDCQYIADASQAFSEAIRSDESVIIVTGSLYLISVLRPLVRAMVD